MKLLKLIISFFKNSKPKVDPVPPVITPPIPKPIESKPVPQKESEIKKIAIIVGHGNGDSGAMGWNGMGEFNFNQFVAETIEQSPLNKKVKVFYRGSTGIVGVAAKAIAWMPDMTLELHLNAFNGKAKGCEVLCLKGDLHSGEYAKDFAQKFCKKFDRTLRRDAGINWIDSGDRGGASLKAVSSAKYSLLVEPFFIDNKDEWIEPIKYADFLIEWINEL